MFLEQLLPNMSLIRYVNELGMEENTAVLNMLLVVFIHLRFWQYSRVYCTMDT